MTRWTIALLFAGLAGLTACKSSSKAGPASPTPDTKAAPTVTADCSDYEHQVDLCRPSCPECAGDTPGNSCNVCAEACATRIQCAQCTGAEACPE